MSEIRLNERNEVVSVITEDGKLIKSSVILSNATPHETFLNLLPSESLETKFKQSIERISYKSPVTKINGNSSFLVTTSNLVDIF